MTDAMAPLVAATAEGPTRTHRQPVGPVSEETLPGPHAAQHIADGMPYRKGHAEFPDHPDHHPSPPDTAGAHAPGETP